LIGLYVLFLLGVFTKDESNLKGDIIRVVKPKFMLSGGFHRNVKTRLIQGVLGVDLLDK
jgi:hypothetical protein